jgi:radical SAM protein with 4Fe4S-binding SPASM domain
MKLLNPCNITLSVSIVVINENLDEVLPFIDVVKGLDVDIKLKRVYGGDAEKLFATDAAKTESIFKEVAKRTANINTNVISTPGNFYKWAKREREPTFKEIMFAKAIVDVPGSRLSLPECVYPWGSFVIHADGDVMPCLFSDRSAGNINKVSLFEIWNNSDFQFLRETVNTKKLMPGCQRCTLYVHE